MNGETAVLAGLVLIILVITFVYLIFDEEGLNGRKRKPNK